MTRQYDEHFSVLSFTTCPVCQLNTNPAHNILGNSVIYCVNPGCVSPYTHVGCIPQFFDLAFGHFSCQCCDAPYFSSVHYTDDLTDRLRNRDVPRCGRLLGCPYGRDIFVNNETNIECHRCSTNYHSFCFQDIGGCKRCPEIVVSLDEDEETELEIQKNLKFFLDNIFI